MEEELTAFHALRSSYAQGTIAQGGEGVRGVLTFSPYTNAGALVYTAPLWIRDEARVRRGGPFFPVPIRESVKFARGSEIREVIGLFLSVKMPKTFRWRFPPLSHRVPCPMLAVGSKT
jgi:hypothetical protein